MTDAPWEPACMDPGDWDGWKRLNGLSGANRVALPCHDCLLGFAAEMRAIDRCNGTPMGDPDHDEEDPTMDTPTTPQTRKVTVSVVAPCGGCTHQVVCRIAEEVRAVAETPVLVPKLGDGLGMVLSASIECEYFAPVKRPKAVPTGDPKPRREMTEEQREAARQRMLHARAIGVARKAAEAA